MNAIQKQKETLSEEESYAGKYQEEFTKFSQDSSENEVHIGRKKMRVKSRLSLYQSRLKNKKC